MTAASHNRPVRIDAGLQSALLILLIWISLLGYSFVSAPLPAANEPHYLTKAYHYWNPSWCNEDLFLESANAHLVFYQTFGLLTVLFPFPVAAVIGRSLALLLFAVGWGFCMRPILPHRWGPLPAVWLFLAISSIGNFSGEWTIGGVESKVLAYGFLLFSLGHLFRAEYCRGGVHAGLAIAFHPVVGGWAVVAMAGALLWGYLSGLITLPMKRLCWATVLMLIASAPGLIPALLLVGGGVPEADYLQVYVRLGHHLDPMQFPPFAWLYYIALILVWLGGRITLRPIAAEVLFTRFVAMTVLIATVGLIVGYRTGPVEEMWFGSLRTGLLKFYFFRMADVFIPIGASVTVTRLLWQWYAGINATCLQFPSSMRQGIVILLLVGVIVLPYTKAGHNPSRMKPWRKRDWVEACEWIKANTSEDALFMTPRHAWAFTWFSDRSEYFAYKNMPQDAVSLLEWSERHEYQRDWLNRSFIEGTSPERKRVWKAGPEAVTELRSRTSATHCILHNSLTLPGTPAYRNRSYSVYSLDEKQ
ncbi:hypothetical protein Pla110_10700 [Polystyrenella longa]|uniref:DUF6798 domain-containing protein n=1 Tax=Polystyrenella longa TaxID=2528007 RepID=A0A518CJF9_9PLAN|nr:DUF6798 domain-containing protein [Polystyrenella longa]QDU79362.1 hypothetical protein Pla110_10700 [Polystyrenella longa]